MFKLVKELYEFAINMAFGSPNRSTPRVRKLKAFLWFFVGIAATVTVVRFGRGLGASTELTDITPWGLWIGFDVMGGVALAAGGFVIAATVYIFHLHRYHAIVRAAVLTAFLGYIAVAVGLLYDIGLPWNLWRPMFYWQHHSALFEVAWCVMLYLTVLAMEFAPVVFEKMPFPRLFAFFKKITLPLVILGIMLSTLHQSSLGTLFLIMPFRVHPLWYTPILPLLYFVSAIGLGIGMVTLESIVSHWLYNKDQELDLLRGLARAASVVLGIYVAIKFIDIFAQGKAAYLFDGSWESGLFFFEMLISAIIPAILFSIPKVRQSAAGLLTAAAMVVFGFVLNRLDVAWLATIWSTNTTYFPSWTEFAVSIGIVSGAALVFFFFVEHFNVFEPEEGDEEITEDPIAIPEMDPVTQVRVDSPWAGDTAIFSFIFILGAAIALLIMPDGSVMGAKPMSTPVEPVRMISAQQAKESGAAFSTLTLTNTAAANMDLRDVLLVDGNQDGRFVLFDHEGHQARQGNKESCMQCHHINNPLDQGTSCSECHSDMYLQADIFDHTMHQKKMGGNEACIECHTDLSKPKVVENTKDCLSCHQGMLSKGTLVKAGQPDQLRLAPSFQDAMHGLCVECHKQEITQKPSLSADFARCAACHSETDSDFLRSLPPYNTMSKDKVAGLVK